MSDSKSAPASKKGGRQRGSFGLGLIVGLLLGLGIALGVALYVTKVPVPFVDKVPQRNAELDAADAQSGKGWNPNAALGGRSRAASGVVGTVPAPAASEPAKAPATAPVTPTPAATPAVTPTAPAAVASKPASPGATAPAPSTAAPKTEPGVVYFVQAGAFTKPEEAEQQRARLGLQGFNAKVYEKDANGRVVYRVRIGPFDAKTEAEALHQQVQEAGMESAVVKTQK